METFGKGETNESMENAYKRDEPTGLLVLPHFAGAATPYMDTGSKGAILGLTVATTAADLYRACMEGVVYEMRLNYEALSGSGIRFTRLNTTGGGAKSKLWMQMKADVLNLPITALKTVDAGTVGSAMLTGIAVGLFSDLSDAASHMVQERETYYPREEMHKKYMVIYERYKAVYNAVRPLM
jgi:xylulokinase